MQTIPACWQWTNFRKLLGLIQRTIYTVEVWCVEVGLSVNPDKMDLVVFTRKRNFLVSLNFTPLHLPCSVRSQPSITGWFWTLGSPGGIIWKPRWRRLRISCGPIGCSLVQHRACSPVSLALHLYNSAIHQLCIFSLVGWLSDSWWQKEAK
jgi:hypothetical protein